MSRPQRSTESFVQRFRIERDAYVVVDVVLCDGKVIEASEPTISTFDDYSVHELDENDRVVCEKVHDLDHWPDGIPVEASAGACFTHSESHRYVFGPICLTKAERSVTLNGSRLALTPSEFDLLALLITDPRKIFSRAAISSHLGRPSQVGGHRHIDALACRLRQKLARDGDRFVLNAWSVGYSLDVPKRESDLTQ